MKSSKPSSKTKPRNARFHATRSSPTYSEEAPAGRREAILSAFDKLWETLFTGPVHLDSALSKQKPYHKSALAQMVQAILLRPVSLAESMGVGSGPGEPWTLREKEGGIAQWRPARLLSQRLYDAMSGKISVPSPVADDFPPAMIADWERAFGRETCDYLIQALATEPPLGIRASQSIGAEKLLQELTEGSRLPVRARVSDLSPIGVRLDGYARIMDSELFESGAFEIQDEGSQVMALFALWPETYGKLLTDKPGEARPKEVVLPPTSVPAWTVVDACAGAGGKTLAFADLLGNRGRIFAYDTSERKLQALKRRAKRAGYNTIQTVALPDDESADQKIAEFKKPADLVLVDAPCSGWGVLRRNPDIKWRQSDETLRRMPEIQLRLLSRYSKLVRPGGRLVYGVCTFRPEETREVVEKFLQAHPDFKALEGGYLGPGPSDGFFMQRFKRD